MRSGSISPISRIALLAAVLCLLPPPPGSAQEDGPADLLLVFDASGSMWGQIQGENKIVIARRVVGELIDGLPDAQRVGLIAYGHRREGDCGDIELVAPLGPLDKGALRSTIDGLNPKGKTPITASLEQAFDAVEASGAGASVILISDGLETCGADPCKRVKLAKEQGLQFVLHVVGFDVAGEDVSSLECAAQAGGGQFHSAENAAELGAALEGAVAMPVDVPAGGLSMKVIANGELHDATVYAEPRDPDVEPAGGRTYASPDTNPRFVPLPGGVYDVTVKAVGLRGDIERKFEATIPEGEVVEREFDFSSGFLSVGVTRNGELGDATVTITVAGTDQQVGAGRTYTSQNSNPGGFELTSGSYDVWVKSVEISGSPEHEFTGIEIGPDADATVSHEFSSGTLKVGSSRSGELGDSVLNVVDAATGKSVAGGRTYRSATTNPKTFTLAPGEYRLSVREVGGAKAEESFTVTIDKGGTVERMVEYPDTDAGYLRRNPIVSPYPYPLLIRHLLHTPLAQSPSQKIVYADRYRYDYRGLVRRIGRLGSALTGLGVKPGDTVAVLDWDSHRYLECFFGIPMLGAVLHTVNVRLSPEQILYTINHAEDDVLLVHTDFMPLMEQIAGRIERDVRIVAMTEGGAAETGLDIAGEYEELLGAADPDFPFQDFDELTRATTFYTTGTTGPPKGVTFAHRQIVLHTLGIMLALNWTAGHARFHRDDVYMPITPMFHVHAWGIPYGATLMGVKQVYPGRYEPDVLFDLIEHHGVTFSHCVPTILHMLLSHPRAESANLRNWKVIIGGAAMPQGLAKRAMSLGIDIYSAYGMSETCPFLTASTLDGDRVELGIDEQVPLRCKTGRPGPLVDLKVVDADGNEVPRDGKSAGEIVARAPWLTQGYYKNQEATDELWRGGYLHTGDIAVVDEEGYLQITDRLKDVIKSGGEWVSSLELENIVSQLDGVGEVAAIGIPDEKWSERPLVIVVPASAAVTEAAVKAHIKDFAERGVISPWAVPERVELVEAIEKTSVGKIDKKVLREKYST